jgi:hypothetical protein
MTGRHNDVMITSLWLSPGPPMAVRRSASPRGSNITQLWLVGSVGTPHKSRPLPRASIKMTEPITPYLLTTFVEPAPSPSDPPDAPDVYRSLGVAVVAWGRRASLCRREPQDHDQMSGLRERAHLREELLGGASQSGQLRDSGQRNRRNKGPSATEDKRWPASRQNHFHRCES